MANLHSVLLEALIKGGEGSGHFNHDGIPEHQGGSLPTYGRKKPAEAKVRHAKAPKAKTKAKGKFASLIDQMTGGAKPTPTPAITKPAPKAAKPAPKPKAAALVAEMTSAGAEAEGGFKVPTEQWSSLEDAIGREEYRTNPLLNVLTGNADPKRVPDGPDFVKRAQGAAAEDKVRALAEEIGITPQEADFFYAEWGVSSNSLFSLGVQAEAAEEFGVPITEWQKGKIAEGEARRESILSKVRSNLAKMTEWNGFRAIDMLNNSLGYSEADRPFETAGLIRLWGEVRDETTTITDEADLWRRLDDIDREGRAKARAAVRFTYEQTQKQLAAAGIKEVRLFRGMQVPGEAMARAAEGSTARVTSNALSSWSASVRTASAFGYLEANGTRVVLDAIVPASRIYSTAGSGQGCMSEWEMVVLGSPEDQVRVFKRADQKVSKSIKGGEGSGHFDHDGIPEHQGGSLPSYGRKKPAEAKVRRTTAKKAKKATGVYAVPEGNESPVDDVLHAYRYDHPLLEMYVGQKPTYTDEGGWLRDIRGQRKNEIVTRLSKGTGISYDECNAFIKQWSVSSNDSDMASLVIQQEAAAEFGAGLTEWQQANYDSVKTTRDYIIDRAIAPSQPGDPFDGKEAAYRVSTALGNAWPSVSLPFEKPALKAFMEKTMNANTPLYETEAAFRAALAGVEKESRAKTRKALRFTYDETQKQLAAAGIKEVHLYRGSVLPDDETTGMVVGEATTMATNTLSSWSFSRGVAEDFASGYGGDFGNRASRAVIVDAIVPASRIYATAVSGPGCLTEWEMITVGSAQDTVRVYAIDNKRIKKSATIKGGEGSGHFNHAGIPEHQGGSLPSKGPKAKGKAKEIGDGGPGKRLPKVADAPMTDPRLVAELGVEEFTPDYAHREHPLMRLWAAGEPEFASEHAGPDLYHGGATGPMMKREQARMRQIAKVTGTTKADAENFLTTWLESSNNKHLGSLAIQEEAAGLWGVPLSDWQAEKLKAAKIAREKRVDQMFTLAERYHETTDDVFEQILSGFKTTELYPFEGDTRKRYLAEKKAGQVIRTREAALAWLADSEAKGREATRKALAFVYQNTQAAFAEAGITHVMAYRGVSAEPKTYQKYEVGDTLAFQANTLSSWSLSRRVVNNLFSSPGLESTSVGLEAAIPVERIVSSAATGLGATQEWEVIVLGNTDADSAHIYQIKYPPSYKKSMKGGPGSGFRDHDGRPGLQGGSLPSVDVEFDGRVWNGETHEGGTVLSKLDTGKMGEDAVIDILSEIYGVPFGTVNVNVNNAPFDVVGDHHAVEVKTGMATNGKSAQQWRATIGQPGKKETELLKNMDPAQKRAHNEWKMKAILDRKHALLDKMSAEAGQPMRPRTMGLILNGEGTKADVFSFEGFHLRLPWNKHATNEHYLGTYDLRAKKMHWKNGEKPTKAAPYFVKSTTQSGAAMKSLLNELVGGAGAAPKGHPIQAAALAAIDADFEQVYAWWTAHYDPATGLPRAEKTVPVSGYRTMSILAQLTKGGPGSGNFAPGHRGRPGEQGGSLPQDGPADGVAVWDENVKNRVQFRFQGRTVSMQGDLLSMYEYGFTPDGLARLADIGEGDFDTTVVLTEKRSGDLEIACETYDRGHTKVIMAVKRTLERNARVARLNYLALDASLQKRGLGTRKAHEWYTTLADAGYKQAFLLANSTVGCYAWAKEGAQYEFAQTAIEKSFAFPYWAQKHKAPGFEESRNWPRFANPQDVANYTHPDGFTVTGAQITNEAVDKKLVMPLGKAFMLDEKGHGQWNAVIDLTLWKGRTHKATALPGSLGHGPKWIVVEMTESTPGESDARFWAQYLEEDEGAPLFDFIGTTTKSGPTKGGEGSGHFDHRGIPEHQGGSLPSKGPGKGKSKRSKLLDQMTKPGQTGGGSVKLTGEVKRLAAFGLDQAMLDRATDLSAEGFQAQAVVKMNGADLNIEGTWTDAAGATIGKFNRTFKPGGEIVILEELALEKPYMGHGLGTKAAHQWFTALAEAGYTRAEMVANAQIGKYAWAKEGAQYKDPGAAAYATETFGYWLDARGVYLDDYPVFKTPKDVAEFRHPDGVTISGETIDNSAVPAEAQVPLGKAFMLDEGGHSLWEAVIDLRQWKGKKKK